MAVFVLLEVRIVSTTFSLDHNIFILSQLARHGAICQAKRLTRRADSEKVSTRCVVDY